MGLFFSQLHAISSIGDSRGSSHGVHREYSNAVIVLCLNRDARRSLSVSISPDLYNNLNDR